ncbi:MULTISPECIES: O-antigen polysaccharide polymerase Wzy [Legionella]|uniref:O-antigen polysaccharide polymerase Wzy n=1 Tax=Legionella TaxID=445 RepID=UPI000964FE25|nr:MULTISPECIES: O-antigen polysaccharide polymerase Wzy [Legionella]MBN9227208.1 hypothetical protein [Legionella steelei]OJW07230.1 MAG: hypothetical protein BGO44_16530 [Legionella sp. 39-23]
MLINDDKKSSPIGTVIIFFVLICLYYCGILLCNFTFDNDSLIELLVITSALSAILIARASYNIIFFSRLSLLFLVGVYPVTIKLIDPEYFFSVFEFKTQSLEITTLMYGLTLIALPSAFIGWLIGQKLFHFAKRPVANLNLDYYRFFFYASGVAVLYFGHMIAVSSGGTIFNIAYGESTSGTPLLGTAAATGGVALSIMFYCALVLGERKYLALFAMAAFYLLIWCQFIRGLRQECIGTSFSIFIIYLMFHHKKIGWRAIYFIYMIPLYLFLELWGLVRTGLHLYLSGETGVSDVINMGLGNAAIMDHVVYSGTLGPITTTFANTVYLIENGLISFLYGSGFVDYIWRTLPSFLYPERPQDLAYIFQDYGLSSGGGFFELAEAYLNFGMWGAALVPLCISLAISCVYTYAKNGASLYRFFALSALLCVWLRGAWYQTFAYYKSFISATLLFLILSFICALYMMVKFPTKRLKQFSS